MDYLTYYLNYLGLPNEKDLPKVSYLGYLNLKDLLNGLEIVRDYLKGYSKDCLTYYLSYWGLKKDCLRNSDLKKESYSDYLKKKDFSKVSSNDLAS